MSTAVFACIVIMCFYSCSMQASDKSIKADIATKAKSDINFAGVSYTVEGGIVTVTGTCASDISKNEVEKTIKSINVINGIRDEIKIAPVVISTDLPLKQKVDSILAGYPAVQADVAQNIVTIKGKAPKQEAGKLIAVINSLHATKVENQLIVQ